MTDATGRISARSDDLRRAPMVTAVRRIARSSAAAVREKRWHDLSPWVDLDELLAQADRDLVLWDPKLGAVMRFLDLLACEAIHMQEDLDDGLPFSQGCHLLEEMDTNSTDENLVIPEPLLRFAPRF